MSLQNSKHGIVVHQMGVQPMSLVAGNPNRMMYSHKLKDYSLKRYLPKVLGSHNAGHVEKGVT